MRFVYEDSGKYPNKILPNSYCSMHGTGESYPYHFLANQFTAFDLDGDEFVTKEEIRQGLFSIVYRTVSSSNLKQ